MSKKITIITVNYNNKAGLEKTIDSVIHQSINDFEFIVIDGDSTDGSAKLIEKYKNSFAYHVSEPDEGIYNAMNKGIRNATGDYILFLNSGDMLYAPDTLEKVQFQITGEHGFYYGDAIYLEPEGDVRRTYPDQLSFLFFFEHNLSHQATFIKRTLFQEIFFYNEKLKIVSDWEFFIYAICKLNISYSHLKQIICKYDVDGISSVLENHKLMHQERKVVIAKHFPLFVVDYSRIVAANSKRASQFFYIQQHKFAYKILKAFMSFILVFLPKSK